MAIEPKQRLEAIELSYIRLAKMGRFPSCHIVLSDASQSARFFYAIFESWSDFQQYMKKKYPTLIVPAAKGAAKKQAIEDLKSSLNLPTKDKKGSRK